MQKNFELLFTALSLITIELANEEVMIDLMRLSIALQVCSPTLTVIHLAVIHLDLNPKRLSRSKIQDFLFIMLISVLIG